MEHQGQLGQLAHKGQPVWLERQEVRQGQRDQRDQRGLKGLSARLGLSVRPAPCRGRKATLEYRAQLDQRGLKALLARKVQRATPDKCRKLQQTRTIMVVRTRRGIIWIRCLLRSTRRFSVAIQKRLRQQRVTATTV